MLKTFLSKSFYWPLRFEKVLYSSTNRLTINTLDRFKHKQSETQPITWQFTQSILNLFQPHLHDSTLPLITTKLFKIGLTYLHRHFTNLSPTYSISLQLGNRILSKEKTPKPKKSRKLANLRICPTTSPWLPVHYPYKLACPTGIRYQLGEEWNVESVCHSWATQEKKPRERREARQRPRARSPSNFAVKRPLCVTRGFAKVRSAR